MKIVVSSTDENLDSKGKRVKFYKFLINLIKQEAEL